MSLFNSSDVEESVQDQVSELKGEPEVPVDDDSSDLEEDVNELKQRHAELSAKVEDNNRDRIEDLSDKVDDLQVLRERFDSLEEELEEKISEKQELEQEMFELEQKFNKKVKENNELKDRLDSMSQKLEELEERVNSTAIEEKVDRTRFEGRIKELEDRLEKGHPELEERIERIEEEEKVDKSMLENRIDRVWEELDEKIGEETAKVLDDTPDKSEVGSLWASLEMLEDKLETLKESKPDRNEYEEKFDTLEDKVHSFENEITGLSKSIDNLENRNLVVEQQFQEESEDLRRQINQDVMELKEKISSKYATSKEIRALWEALEALEERQDDVEIVIDEIDEQGVDELGKLKDTMKYLEHKVDDLDAIEARVDDISQLEERLKDMEMIVQGMDDNTVSGEEFKELFENVLELSEMVKTLAQSK